MDSCFDSQSICIAVFLILIGLLFNILIIYVTYHKEGKLLSTDIIVIALSIVKTLNCLIDAGLLYSAVCKQDLPDITRQIVDCIGMILHGMYIVYLATVAVLQNKAVIGIIKLQTQKNNRRSVVQSMIATSFLVVSFFVAIEVITHSFMKNDPEWIQRILSLMSFISATLIVLIISCLYGRAVNNIRKAVNMIRPGVRSSWNRTFQTSMAYLKSSLWSIFFLFIFIIIPVLVSNTFSIVSGWYGMRNIETIKVISISLFMLHPIGMGLFLKRKRQIVKQLVLCKSSIVSDSTINLQRTIHRQSVFKSRKQSTRKCQVMTESDSSSAAQRPLSISNAVIFEDIEDMEDPFNSTCKQDNLPNLDCIHQNLTVNDHNSCSTSSQTDQCSLFLSLPFTSLCSDSSFISSPNNSPFLLTSTTPSMKRTFSSRQRIRSTKYLSSNTTPTLSLGDHSRFSFSGSLSSVFIEDYSCTNSPSIATQHYSANTSLSDSSGEIALRLESYPSITDFF